MMSSFADLPRELLELIADRICDHRDFVHFGAVCKLWRSIVLENLHQIPYKLPLSKCLPCERPLPLLMQCNYENATVTADFFCIRDQQIYSGFILPGIDNNMWISGSFDGWVATVEVPSRQIELLNPLTGAQIPLPSLSALKHPMANFNEIDLYDFGLVPKVIKLSGSSRRDPDVDCIVVALLPCLSVLSFCRLGDDKWTNIKASPERLIDVIAYRGQVYAVDYFGCIIACDVAGNQKTTPIAGGVHDFGRRYLVESTSGDLLQVVKEYDHSLPKKITAIDFTVFKLESRHDPQIDLEEPFDCYFIVDGKSVKSVGLRSEWVELDDLGDQMLFLGQNHSMSFSASSYPGWKGNCIYFTDEDDRRIYDEHELCSDVVNYNMGMYDMESGDVFPLEEMKDMCFTLPPVWVVPNPW